MIKRLLRDDVLSGVRKLGPIADELNFTQAQLAIAWVLQNDNVAAALVGASRPEQVTANVKAVVMTNDPFDPANPDNSQSFIQGAGTRAMSPKAVPGSVM